MESLNELVALMPKVELHAHLNGSISDRLLEHLRVFSENDAGNTNLYPDLDSDGILLDADTKSESTSSSEASLKAANLEECWAAFAKIHQVIQTPRILYVATVNIIAEFSQDNVAYLEIRTGPKKVHQIPSKMAYLEAVVEAIKDVKNRFPIIVKLLISVDRKTGEQSGFENVQLAGLMKEEYPDVVTGIDISGDPIHGHYNWIVPVMQLARNKGLKISCHLAEIVNPEEGLAFMRFGPERVGHGQFLHPQYGGNEELWRVTKDRKIPIECCLSSNVMSGVAKSVEKHIVRNLHEERLPYVICTDDSGVFKTTLTNEFRKLLVVLPLSARQLRDLNLQAVDYTFAEENEKAALRHKINDWWQQRVGNIDEEC